MGTKHARWVGLVLVLATGLAIPSASWADGPAAASAWETIRQEDGIVVAKKDVPGSSFIAFRGEGDVGAPLLLVGSVIVDITRGKEWIDSMEDSKILRQISESEYVTYSHIGTPITMSDREFVTDVKISVDPAHKQLAIHMHSVNDPAAPKTSYVRGELSDSSFVLTESPDGKSTHVVAEIHCDPKGSVAAWIVNMFQKNWGYKTLSSLRAQVRKKDIAVHEHLKSVLIEKGFYADVK